jgi:predicted AAA+ superfamily ATPase
MIKYAPTGEKSKIRECFDTIPQQLSRENKKFSYALVQKKGSADKFAGSLQWMEDAGIIQRCYNLNITELPLAGNADKSSFKVYMADIGLFISMLEDGTQADIIHGSLLGYKGAIFENLVADFLSKADRKLYYFRKDSGLEIDFVTRISGECVLVECKATTGNAKSTRTVLRHPEKYHVDHAVKLGRYNIGYADGLLTLPLYMGFFLSRLSL